MKKLGIWSFSIQNLENYAAILILFLSGLVLAIIIEMVMMMQVEAASIQESETDLEKVYTLTFEETKEGKVAEKDIPQTYEYEGKEYQLVSADIEYSYVKKEDSIAIGNVTERYLINPGEVKNIPKYVTVGNILYVLDEGSVSVKTTGTEFSEGADVVTMTKSLDDLPDNDLTRIPLEAEEDGISYMLLYVTYSVTDEDEYGIPIKYSAECHYGGLKTYSVPYDIAWEVAVVYTGYRSQEYVKSSEINYVYELREEIESEIPEAEPAEVVLVEPKEPENMEKMNVLPMAVGATGGVFFITLAGVYFLTVPVYAALGTGDYKYIGRMRLKRCKSQGKYERRKYEGVFSERLAKKGEIGNFMIKIPKRIQNRSNVGMLQIKCPDGSVIRKRLQDKVMFSVP